MFGPRNSYAGDPRRIVAKYDGKDMHGVPFKKGDTVTYYPNGKRIIAGKAGEDTFRKFEAEAADEKLFGG